MRRANRQREETPQSACRSKGVWHRSRCNKAGAVVIEQVLFLALITGGVSFATDSVGLATQNTLSQLTTASHQSAEAEEAFVGQADPFLPNSDLTIELASAEQSVYLLRLTAVGGILVLGFGIWYLLYRKEQRERKALLPSSPRTPEADTDLFSTNVFSKRQDMLRALLADPSLVINNQLTVRQLMSTRLAKVSATATKQKVQHTMERAGTRHLLVCDEAERLVGIISNRDLVRPGNRASQIMTPDPLTLEADSLLLPTITLLLKHCISCLPVTDGGQLVGVLTTTDLVMALQCIFQMVERTGITFDNHSPSEEENRAAEEAATFVS